MPLITNNYTHHQKTRKKTPVKPAQTQAKNNLAIHSNMRFNSITIKNKKNTQLSHRPSYFYYFSEYQQEFPQPARSTNLLGGSPRVSNNRFCLLYQLQYPSLRCQDLQISDKRSFSFSPSKGDNQLLVKKIHCSQFRPCSSLVPLQ